MSHKRIEIKDAIAKELSQLGFVRTFLERRIPVETHELPAILISSVDEGREELCESTQISKREYRVLIEAVTTAIPRLGEESLENNLETLCMYIEEVLSKAQTLGGLIHKISLTQTTFGHSNQTEELTEVAKLHYTITYFADENRCDLMEVA